MPHCDSLPIWPMNKTMNKTADTRCPTRSASRTFASSALYTESDQPPRAPLMRHRFETSLKPGFVIMFYEGEVGPVQSCGGGGPQNGVGGPVAFETGAAAPPRGVAAKVAPPQRPPHGMHCTAQAWIRPGWRGHTYRAWTAGAHTQMGWRVLSPTSFTLVSTSSPIAAAAAAAATPALAAWPAG